MQHDQKNNIINIAVKCWLLTLRDGTKIGLHDHDTEILIDGVIYHANACEVSAMSQSITKKQESFELKHTLNHDSIQLDDIMSGRYDGAIIESFIFDLLNQKKTWQQRGIIREIALNEGKITANVHNISALLEHKIGSFYSENCRAQFADQQCKAPDLYSLETHITQVLSERSFLINHVIDINTPYLHGKVLFLSGRNLSFYSGIHLINKNCLEIKLSTPFKILNGDKLKVMAGCNKSLRMCSNIYNNTVNFRGEPHIPGIQEVL